MKELLKHFAASLLFITIVLGGYLFYTEISFGQGEIKELVPLVTHTVNRREKSATLAAAVKISDSVSGKTAFFPQSLLITYKGDELLVLVNKKIRLPQNFVPKDLVSLNGQIAGSTAGFYLKAEALTQLKNMFAEAESEGLGLKVNSPYRSYYQQQSVFNNWVRLAGLKQAESFSARAGHSQHQLGTAVDVSAKSSTSPFNQDFGKTSEGIWLAKNAAKYGYVLSYPKGKELITGYSYEPWHWRYIGVENAQKMVASSLILEEYLTKFGTW